jgi:hypothetical protein
MWRFYWTLIRTIPKLLWTAADLWVSIVAAVLFFTALFNQKLEEKLMISWHALSPWWSALPVGLFLLYRLMRSNYEHYRQMEAGFNETIGALRQDLERELKESSTLRDKYQRLTAEINDLKKPKRSPLEERTFQDIKAKLEKYGEDEKTLLRYLQKHEKIVQNHFMGFSPLPPGFNHDRAAAALSKLLADDLSTFEGRQVPNGWEKVWQIARWAIASLDDLL